MTHREYAARITNTHRMYACIHPDIWRNARATIITANEKMK